MFPIEVTRPVWFTVLGLLYVWALVEAFRMNHWYEGVYFIAPVFLWVTLTRPKSRLVPVRAERPDDGI